MCVAKLCFLVTKRKVSCWRINQSISLSHAKVKLFARNEKKVKKEKRKKNEFDLRGCWLCSAESEEKKCEKQKNEKYVHEEILPLHLSQLYTTLCFFISFTFSFKNEKNFIYFVKEFKVYIIVGALWKFLLINYMICAFWSVNALDCKLLKWWNWNRIWMQSEFKKFLIFKKI